MDLTSAQEKIYPHLESVQDLIHHLEQIDSDIQDLISKQRQLISKRNELISERDRWNEVLTSDMLLLDSVNIESDQTRAERKKWILFIQQNQSKLDQL